MTKKHRFLGGDMDGGRSLGGVGKVSQNGLGARRQIWFVGGVKASVVGSEWVGFGKGWGVVVA